MTFEEIMRLRRASRMETGPVAEAAAGVLASKISPNNPFAWHWRLDGKTGAIFGFERGKGGREYRPWQLGEVMREMDCAETAINLISACENAGVMAGSTFEYTLRVAILEHLNLREGRSEYVPPLVEEIDHNAT